MNNKKKIGRKEDKEQWRLRQIEIIRHKVHQWYLKQKELGLIKARGHTPEMPHAEYLHKSYKTFEL